jgi:hypothetical protein
LNLQRYRTLILVVTTIAALFVASPALQRLLASVPTESFTEMWLLGPENTIENFPFNVTSSGNYKVFLGIGNHLGSVAYYSIHVKLLNQSQLTADPNSPMANSLRPLYSIPAFVADKEAWKLPLTFSFDYTYSANTATTSLSKVNVNTITLNEATLNIEGFSAAWDPENRGFFGYLLFELWIYNGTIGGFQYHERYTSLKFNMTI